MPTGRGKTPGRMPIAGREYPMRAGSSSLHNWIFLTGYWVLLHSISFRPPRLCQESRKHGSRGRSPSISCCFSFPLEGGGPPPFRHMARRRGCGGLREDGRSPTSPTEVSQGTAFQSLLWLRPVAAGTCVDPLRLLFRLAYCRRIRHHSRLERNAPIALGVGGGARRCFFVNKEMRDDIA